MGLPNYTSASIRAARLAGRRAARAGARTVEPEHLLLALLTRNGILKDVAGELGIEFEPLRDRAKQLAGTQHLARRTAPRLSARMEKLLLTAENEAQSLGSRGIKPEHLLLAVVREDGPAAGFLRERGATYAVVRKTLRKLLHLPAPARCPTCNYDLRATPERCPECGEFV